MARASVAYAEEQTPSEIRERDEDAGFYTTIPSSEDDVGLETPPPLSPMYTTLFLEAFGQLAPHTAVIDAAEEDLYSVFRARAELMRWSTMSATTRRSLLWSMHEAELTAGSASSRIGWVQVGMHHDPVGALPALSQCLDDALRRFGDVTLSGLQVTIHGLQPPPRAGVGDRISPRNWFNLAPPAWAKAHIAFDHASIGDHITALPTRFPNTGSFAFGPVVTVPDRHRIQVPTEAPFLQGLEPARRGLAVTLPEWTASAAAHAAALAVNTTRTLADVPRHCAVRVTRVRQDRNRGR